MNLAERKKSDGDTNSFFQWFTDNSDPMSDEIAEVSVSIGLMVIKLAFLELAPSWVLFHAFQVIKDDMWRNPLQYFLALDDNE